MKYEGKVLDEETQVKKKIQCPKIMPEEEKKNTKLEYMYNIYITIDLPIWSHL